METAAATARPSARRGRAMVGPLARGPRAEINPSKTTTRPHCLSSCHVIPGGYRTNGLFQVISRSVAVPARPSSLRARSLSRRACHRVSSRLFSLFFAPKSPRSSRAVASRAHAHACTRRYLARARMPAFFQHRRYIAINDCRTLGGHSLNRPLDTLPDDSLSRRAF